MSRAQTTTMAPVGTISAVVAVISVSLVILSYFLYNYKSNKDKKNTHFSLSKNKKPRSGLVDVVGNTLLIKINSLSEATGCEILGKCMFLNLGGNVKDRVAVKIIEKALESSQLTQGGVVTEGSTVSTAISLTTMAPAYGCKYHMVIPDDVAIEKSQILKALKAAVERVKPVSFIHRDHYVNIARRRALEANELALRLRKAERIDGKDLSQINGYRSTGKKQSSTFSI